MREYGVKHNSVRKPKNSLLLFRNLDTITESMRTKIVFFVNYYYIVPVRTWIQLFLCGGDRSPASAENFKIGIVTTPSRSRA
jgi:hypothetical protein